MRNKLLKTLTLASLLAFFGMSVAQADIAGSKHDMAEYTSAAAQKTLPTAGGDCRWCHAPHNALTTVPLWDRFNDDHTGTWQPYTSNTMDVAAPNPGGVSLACLSCHDGTTALDSFGQTTGTGDDMATLAAAGPAVGKLPNTDAIVGTDLRQDHPVSMNLVVDAAEFVVAATVDDDLPLYDGANNKVECGTCHDPHKIDNIGVETGETYGLRLNDATLCTTCHKK